MNIQSEREHENYRSEESDSKYKTETKILSSNQNMSLKKVRIIYILL